MPLTRLISAYDEFLTGIDRTCLNLHTGHLAPDAARSWLVGILTHLLCEATSPRNNSRSRALACVQLARQALQGLQAVASVYGDPSGNCALKERQLAATERAIRQRWPRDGVVGAP